MRKVIMLKRIRGLAPPDEKGQGLVEYALILVLVATVIIIILGVFGVSVREVYCDITRQLDPYFHLGIPDVCEETPPDPAPILFNVGGEALSSPGV
jgi:pilus assembly protein Flp/PilA